ncbi:MAG: 23S rRNA (pseudouridine(1915)-N(3))-methyltransferase RlmH [Litoreibacter sp.]
MRVQICAVGRLKSGPELDLIRDYSKRFDRTGRALGLGPISIVEVEDRKGGGMANEGKLLLASVPKGAKVIAMDERGKTMSSPEFSDVIARFRDNGASDLSIIIGGADGISNDVKERADVTLSLGKMVWPHMLARTMLSEQLYRAASILAGAPYHRV